MSRDDDWTVPGRHSGPALTPATRMPRTTSSYLFPARHGASPRAGLFLSSPWQLNRLESVQSLSWMGRTSSPARGTPLATGSPTVNGGLGLHRNGGEKCTLRRWGDEPRASAPPGGGRNQRGVDGTDWIKIDRATYQQCVDPETTGHAGSGRSPPRRSPVTLPPHLSRTLGPVCNPAHKHRFQETVP